LLSSSLFSKWYIKSIQMLRQLGNFLTKNMKLERIFY
jgi:hypothetical protein